ncbi:MAG: HipA domain-containing protein [Bacteroidia bacterium]|nr:HipA domain-containing protein [Bacteroidia bacterium]
MEEIQVVADWMKHPIVMGILRGEQLRGKEVFSFSYSKEWLSSGNIQVMDPDLYFFAGPQYLSAEKPNFGLFLDSAPDRWGRMLMDRREALVARQEQRSPRLLFESDYLLGVQDEGRMGGLRLRMGNDKPFLANEPEFKAPPFAMIRDMEQASLFIEDENFFSDKYALKWLSLLIAPGSSLGGARPKANVRDQKGDLWIAKFPSRYDAFDSGAWEYLVYELAKDSDIRVSSAEARIFSGRQHTYLVQRFDRDHGDKRIHFSSAMTLLGHRDGHDYQSGATYLELVEWLEMYGSKPTDDIRQLWQRIVFSVLVSNTDDHLRNHGFILTNHGWRLSPAYDLNPNPRGTGLSLNISELDNSLSLDLCLDVAPYFRWKKDEAHAYIKQTCKVVSQWGAKAIAIGISRSECELMASAFSLANEY